MIINTFAAISFRERQHNTHFFVATHNALLQYIENFKKGENSKYKGEIKVQIEMGKNWLKKKVPICACQSSLTPDEINKHNNLTKIVEVVNEWVIQQKRID